LDLHLLDLIENTTSRFCYYPPGRRQRRNAPVLLDKHLAYISFQL
jgi:hypothetical protein